MKVKLVLRPGEFTSFTSYYLEEFWREYFDIAYYDSTTTYDPRRTVFAIWWMNADDAWAADMAQQGYKIAVDNLWERPAAKNNYYWIEHPGFFRWNEALWTEALGYSSYVPQRDLQYISLMPLGLKKSSRDLLVQELEPLLPTMLWSYFAQNKFLPNDTVDQQQNTRYMHPSWYDTTYCSLVVETYQQGSMQVTEKSYKPMAYYHPYMILGVPGTLKFLKQHGFETFDNLFDESYDHDISLADRIKIIKSNLQRIQLEPYDKLTAEKIEHNHRLFFDVELCRRSIVQEIIEPLLEYAET